MNQPEQKPYQAKPQGYLSLAQASQLTGYHQDYLGALARTGKLEAQKIGRNWVVSESAINKLLGDVTGIPENEFVSFQAAPPSEFDKLREDIKKLRSEIIAHAPHKPQRALNLYKHAVRTLLLVLAAPVILNLANVDLRTGSLAGDVKELVAIRKQEVESKFYNKLAEKLGVRKLEALAEQISGQVAGTSSEKSSGSNYELGITNKGEKVATPNSLFDIPTSAPQVLGLSNDEVIAAFRAVLAEGLPADIQAQLKGEKGDKGDAGLSVGFTSPTSSNPGSYGGFTFNSAKTFSAEILTVTGETTLKTITVSGTGTFDSLTLSGPLSFTGTAHAGIRLNNLTTAQRDLLTPQAGMTIYNTTASKMQVYTSSWKNVGNPEIGAEVTSGTSGSILFVDASGNLQQDNSNFFWDDTNNRLGIGTTGPGQKLHVAGGHVATSGTGFGFAAYGIGVPGDANTEFLRIIHDSPDVFLDSTKTGTGTSRALGFKIGGLEKMRVHTDGTVGIGTTTPEALLHVKASGWSSIFEDPINAAGVRTVLSITRSRADGTDPVAGFGAQMTFNLQGQTDSSRIGAAVIKTSWEVDQTNDTTARDASLDFYTILNNDTGSPKLTIHSSGNVGIGTTNPDRLLTVHSSTAGSATVSKIWNTDNTNAASHAQLEIVNGGSSGGDPKVLYSATGEQSWAHGIDNSDSNKFKIAASGVLETSTALTIDTSGNVGIGTTGPLRLLDVKSTSLPYTAVDTGGTFIVQDTSTSVNLMVGVDATIGSSIQSRLGLGTAKLLLNPFGGNVGIGTTNPDAKLSVNGELSFGQNATIRRTTSDGSDNGYISINGGGGYGQSRGGSIELHGNEESLGTVYIYPGSAGGNFIVAGTDAIANFTVDSTTGNVTIVGSGTTCTIGNGTGATNCTSDARLKENVVDLTPSLDKILSLRPVTYNWIDKKKEQTTNLGLIAQEVQQIFPSTVHTVYDDYLGVDYANLVVPIIGAIQELNAKLSLLSINNVNAIAANWSISDDGHLVVETVKAKKAMLDEIELKDKDTGTIYCVEIKSGALTHTAGECGTQESGIENQESGSEPTTDTSSTDTGESTTETTSVEEPAPEPQPEPTIEETSTEPTPEEGTL